MKNRPVPEFYINYCRLCLQGIGISDVLDSSDLLQDVYSCTGITISMSDGLPHKICEKCTVVIREAKQLKEQAIKTNLYLSSLIVKNDYNVNYDDDEDDDDLIRLVIDEQYVEENGTTNNMDNHNQCVERDTNINNDGTQCDTEQMQSKEESSNTEMIPEYKQTISIRRDLFYPQDVSPTKTQRSQSESETCEASTQSEDKNICPPKKIKLDCKCKNQDPIKVESIEFVCGVCSKVFDKQKKLYLHQLFHNKTIPCPVEGCGKKFAMKGDLEKHQRTHTGEKPYACPKCNRGFTQKVSLRNHMKTVTCRDVEDDD